jgi:hypothetical protein
MLAVTDGELLDMWERSSGLAHAMRAATWASALSADLPAEAAYEMPIGRRDASLIGIRRELFGSSLAATVRCPSCHETVEFDLDLGLIVPAASDTAGEVVDVAVDGWSIVARLPTSADLIAVSPDATPVALLNRCALRIEEGGQPADLRAIPAWVFDKIEEAFAAADPAADITLALDCAACGNRWDEAFDIVTFLGAELDAWARSTLREVAALGRAYGWTENESLALTSTRRRMYIELAAP